MKKINQNAIVLFAFCMVMFSCQKMERPALADYPKDTNPPGGPLKFYVAFDGTSADPLMNAVDSIKANFAAVNPLTTIDGIRGKAVKGIDGKAIKYNSANDFGNNVSSYSISLWLKNTVPPADHYEVPFSFAHKDLYYSTAIHFDVYPVNDGSTVAKANAYYYMEQPNGDYFEAYLTGANGIPGLLDNNWHHLVFTYDESNSTFKLYKDGALLYTQVWTGHGPLVLDNSKLLGLAIGGSNKQAGLAGGNDGWMYSWLGGIDQFRMYGKKVLTAAEVLSLYNNKQ